MIVYLICYGISFILAWQRLYVLSGLVLVGAAIWLYIRDYIRTGNLIHLRGLFCLFFIGGQGVSCFKLSYLQTDWLHYLGQFFVAVMAFWWVFEVLTRMYDGWSASDMGSVYKYYSSADSPLQANRILISMTVITLVSVSALLLRHGDWILCQCFPMVYLTLIPIFTLKESIILLYPAYWFQAFLWYTV